LNDEELTSWTIYPLEFKRSWNQNLGDWGPVDGSVTSPALYKATLTIDDNDITDTYIDMQEWVKGFVIVNGIVVGRYVPALGPQQALYLPGPWLQKGDNEIIVFVFGRRHRLNLLKIQYTIILDFRLFVNIPD
jgi:hypothetical protein